MHSEKRRVGKVVGERRVRDVVVLWVRIHGGKREKGLLGYEMSRRYGGLEMIAVAPKSFVWVDEGEGDKVRFIGSLRYVCRYVAD